MNVRGGCLVGVVCTLVGCGFRVPVQETTAISEQREKRAVLLIGTSTRADVRAALGTPEVESERWRVDLYRAEEERREVEFVVVLVLPVPVGAFRVKERGYVLVAYDEAGRVSDVASGSASEGIVAEDATHWLVLRADDLTLVVDPVKTKPRTTLLADAGRLPAYLQTRRKSADCTLVVACDPGERCPEEFALEGGDAIEPRPIEVLTGSSIVDRIPIVHALSVAPGSHRIAGGKDSFECVPGDVVYANVRGAAGRRDEPKSSFSKTPPSDRVDLPLVLHRNGRWWVDRLPA